MKAKQVLTALSLAGLLFGILGCSKKNPTGPTTGNLQISSTPSGASLTLDGQARGTTPITINGLSTGNHNAKVTYTNYYDYTDVVNIVAGQTLTKAYTLTAITGVANIATNPIGATLFVDGANKGTTPLTVTGLSLAKHRFEVQKTNYFWWSESINVTGPDTIRRNYNLFPTGYTNVWGQDYLGSRWARTFYTWVDSVYTWLNLNADVPTSETLLVWWSWSGGNSGHYTQAMSPGWRYYPDVWYPGNATGYFYSYFYWKMPGANDSLLIGWDSFNVPYKGSSQPSIQTNSIIKGANTFSAPRKPPQR